MEVWRTFGGSRRPEVRLWKLPAGEFGPERTLSFKTGYFGTAPGTLSVIAGYRRELEDINLRLSILVIPGEDPAGLQAMSDGYTHEWAPKTYLERFLVDSLVRADWLL